MKVSNSLCGPYKPLERINIMAPFRILWDIFVKVFYVVVGNMTFYMPDSYISVGFEPAINVMLCYIQLGIKMSNI